MCGKWAVSDETFEFKRCWESMISSQACSLLGFPLGSLLFHLVGYGPFSPSLVPFFCPFFFFAWNASVYKDGFFFSLMILFL